jgi:hypothetical protein
MEEITFLVQGSEVEPYAVRFRKSDSNLTADCTCPAGAIGQCCKHRIRILEGNAEGIVSGNAEALKTVASWLAGTDVEIALRNLRATEARLETAKKELSTAKKNLAGALRD